MRIRIANWYDLPAIVEIYNQAIRSRCATGDMDEFTVDERLDWFNQHSRNSYPILVAELDQSVVGFAVLSPYRAGRRAMDSVAEVSFYVDYKHHKMGIGSKLLQHMMMEAKELKIDCLVAILLDINEASIALLEKHGFNKWAFLPDIIHFEDKTCSHLYYGIKGLMQSKE